MVVGERLRTLRDFRNSWTRASRLKGSGPGFAFIGWPYPFQGWFYRCALFPLLLPWVALLVVSFQVGSDRADIDLRGLQIGMAKHLLHGHDVGPVLNQPAGEGVAEGVRGDLFADVGGPGVVPDADR